MKKSSKKNSNKKGNIWYRIYQEMQKKGIDKAALVASNPTCKFCNLTLPQCSSNAKKGQFIDSADRTEIENLNEWQPKSIKKKNDQTEVKEMFNFAPKQNEEKNDACEKMPKKPKNQKLPSDKQSKERMKTRINNIRQISLERLDTKDEETNTLPEESADEKISFSSQENTSCQTDSCKCNKKLAEETKRFLDELHFQLKSLRKDKSCMAVVDEEPKDDTKFCTICEDVDICEIFHKKVLAREIEVPLWELDDEHLETIFEDNSADNYLSSTMLLLKSSSYKKRVTLTDDEKLRSYLKSDSKDTQASLRSYLIQEDISRRLNRAFSRQSTAVNLDSYSDESIITQSSLLWYSSEIHN